MKKQVLSLMAVAVMVLSSAAVCAQEPEGQPEAAQTEQSESSEQDAPAAENAEAGEQSEAAAE